VPVDNRYEKLFSPGTIGTMRLRNRIVMAPIVTQFATDTGAASQVHRDYLAERAKGGVGLIIAEASYVDRSGRAFGCQLGIDRDELLSSHVRLTEAVHRYEAKIAIQLHHGGSRANPKFTGGRIVSSSVVKGLHATPEALTLDEIAALVERHGEAADRAKRAGYDAVEIHGAHGYLLHQFLSPATNIRTDDYGGSPENRMRFTLEVIRSVRQAVGPDYPVIYRLSTEGGYGLEDSVAFAAQWAEAGVDALNVSIGGTAPITLLTPETSPMSIPQGYLADYVHAVKKAVSIPVMCVGEIREPAVAESILVQGKADYVALARALMTDPFWPEKASQGREKEILKCISCDECRFCLYRGLPVRCLINPQLGREGWLKEPEPAATSRRVMVVGGGPAGMEVARVAALRGHQVSLYESKPALGGGQLTLAEAPPHKEKLRWLGEYLTWKIESLPVTVHAESSVDRAAVEREAPDVLVVATGAVPIIPDIPGINGDNVVTAFRMLEGELATEGKKVVVLGGRRVGTETAEYLTLRGASVTVVTRSPLSQLAIDATPTYRAPLLRRLRNADVKFIGDHEVKEINRQGLTLLGPDKEEEFLAADLVVIARGAVPQRSLADEAADLVREIHVIGDSVEPRSIAEAMYEGTMAGRRI
jgi:2,4-dienoyl-CoA reductase-like NADH-dependent reductase (Old Yellow Enzyme family)/thioredoxin reductase